MDPISAAGIGIGVTSLTFQLFSGCVKGYQLFLDAAGMPKRFEHIQVRMRLELVRLLSWGDQVGLLEETLEEPSLILRMHHNLIFDILLQLHNLFRDCMKIQERFSATVARQTNSSGVSSTATDISVFGQNTTTLFEKATRILHRTSELPKRLEWALVKQEKFEKMVEQLISYNTSMLSLLDRRSLQQVNQTQIQSELTLLQLSRDVDSLKHLVLAVQLEPAQKATISVGRRQHAISGTTDQSHPEESMQLDLAALATFKANRLDSERDNANPAEMLIDIRDIRFVGSTSRIDLAAFQDMSVWIEWKEFDQQNLNPWYQDMLEIRVKRLATLLHVQDTPVQFKGPTCLGYIHESDEDMTRYGFVYKVPANAWSKTTPRSLLDLIKHEKRPSLTNRIKLASLLADSIMHLHAVNWLHKGIRSDAIIFFPDAEGKIMYDLPTISSFDFSRPDEPGEMTEKPKANLEHDIYCHPHSIDHPRARSRKSWDIYSLGIVLFEIAYWKSIDKITDIDVKEPKAKSKVRRLRDRLLGEAFLDEVGMICGESYQKVVTRCLTGGHCLDIETDADESDPHVAANMIRAFSRDIVDVLAQIQV